MSELPWILYKNQHGKVHDRLFLTSEGTSHEKQNCICLDWNQNLGMSPGGAQRQDGRTDRQTD